jgi:hypothetical protein
MESNSFFLLFSQDLLIVRWMAQTLRNDARHQAKSPLAWTKVSICACRQDDQEFRRACVIAEPTKVLVQVGRNSCGLSVARNERRKAVPRQACTSLESQRLHKPHEFTPPCTRERSVLAMSSQKLINQKWQISCRNP